MPGATGPTGADGGFPVNTEPENARLYTANACDKTVDIWSGATGTKLGSITLPSAPTSIAVNPTTKKAYVTTVSDGLNIIDLSTNTITTYSPSNYQGKSAVNPNTNLIYVGDTADAILYIVGGSSDSVDETVQLQSKATSIAVDPVLNKIYVVESDASVLQIIDGATNTIEKTVTGFNNVSSVAVNAVTHKVYVASMNSNSPSLASGALLTTIDGTTNTTINQQAFPGGSGGVPSKALAVNTVTNQVTAASNGTSGSTYLFDDNGNLIRTFHNASLNYLDKNSATVNPETGNLYESAYNGGVEIFNGNGTQIQMIPANCVNDIAVTNL